MNKIQLILRNSIFIKLFFILAGFYLVQLHNASNIPADNCNAIVQTNTELVISIEPEIEIHSIELATPEIPNSDFSQTDFSLLTKYKFALFCYKNYVLEQLKYFSQSFTLTHQFIFILQSNNIWHQASDEDIDSKIIS